MASNAAETSSPGLMEAYVESLRISWTGSDDRKSFSISTLLLLLFWLLFIYNPLLIIIRLGVDDIVDGDEEEECRRNEKLET